MSVEIDSSDKNTVWIHQHWHVKNWQIWSIDKEIIFNSSTCVGFRTNQKPLVGTINDQPETASRDFKQRIRRRVSKPGLIGNIESHSGSILSPGKFKISGVDDPVASKQLKNLIGTGIG